MNNKFEAKQHDGTLFWGVWNNDMSAFQYISSWDSNKCYHQSHAIRKAKELNEKNLARLKK